MSRTRHTAALLLAVVLRAGTAHAEEPSPFDGQGGTPVQTPPTAGVDNAASTTQVAGGATTSGGGSGGGAEADSHEYRQRVLPGPCPVTPLDATPQLVQIERRLRSGGAWEPVGPAQCTGQAAPAAPAPVVDLDDIRGTALTVRAQVSPPRPSLTVQPQAGALVNQPAVFSVEDPGTTPSDSALNPLSQRSVTVRLAAPTYTWTFGDGGSRSAGVRRGQPYARGTTVPQEGTGDPYVSHTYSAAADRTVTVTASYAVSYSFSGDGRVFTLPPLEVSTSAALRVREARSELVSR